MSGVKRGPACQFATIAAWLDHTPVANPARYAAPRAVVSTSRARTSGIPSTVSHIFLSSMYAAVPLNCRGDTTRGLPVDGAWKRMRKGRIPGLHKAVDHRPQLSGRTQAGPAQALARLNEREAVSTPSPPKSAGPSADSSSCWRRVQPPTSPGRAHWNAKTRESPAPDPPDRPRGLPHGGPEEEKPVGVPTGGNRPAPAAALSCLCMPCSASTMAAARWATRCGVFPARSHASICCRSSTLNRLPSCRHRPSPSCPDDQPSTANGLTKQGTRACLQSMRSNRDKRAKSAKSDSMHDTASQLIAASGFQGL